MAISTTVVQGDEPTSDVATNRVRRRWPVASAIFVVLLLVLGGIAASHYQPIVISGGLGINHPNGTHQVQVTQELLLRDSGPLGITVVSFNDGHPYGLGSQVHFASTEICPRTTSKGGDCPQSRKTGLLEGRAFRPFSLTTNSPRGVLVRFDYACAPGDETESAGGYVTLPVTYRFLWFTHTILLSQSADNSAACSSK
jgi:hypothetical protein